MKVKKLVEHLLKFDGNADVMLAGDQEGNHFSKVSDVDVIWYDTKDHDVYSLEDIQIDPTLRKFAKEVVCIWP